MNITERTTHDVQQGTGDWLRLREGFDTASEAPAAQGVSRYVTRAELLRRKHTGVAPEPDAGTLGRFAAGHAAEAKARPLAEGIVGGELYPVTMTAIVDGLPLLASLDGLDLPGDICWETKLWNEELVECVRRGDLPEHYTVQMDQELLVSGASRCLFTCTDGTPERLVSCWYEADPAKFAALVAGWRQFRADLAAYVPPAAAAAAPVGKAPDTLPALRIEVQGMVTASNLAEFKQTAMAAIQSVNRNLKTDQDFADARKSIKWCEDIESRLKAAKEHALSQTADIDALFKAVDDISAEARRVRLDLDKVVTKRSVEVKEEAVTAARAALDAHVAALNAELAPMALRPVAADFAGSIKGLRSIASMQDALDTALAAGKIAADQQARGIRANVAAFKAATGDDRALQALFADLGQLVHKAGDDFAAVLDQRITKHRADEAAREAQRQAAEAQRIAAAEQRAREQAEREAAQRLADERAKQAQAEAAAALAQAAKVTEPQPPQQVLKAEPATADATDRGTAAIVSPRVGAMGAGQAADAAPAVAEPATINMSALADMLGFQLRADFIAQVLGIQAAGRAGAAVLYRPSQVPLIVAALQRHLARVLAGLSVAA